MGESAPGTVDVNDGTAYTFLALLRRPALAAVHACYAFIHKMGTKAAPLWPAVCRELRWMRSLIPLLRRDLRQVRRPLHQV